MIAQTTCMGIRQKLHKFERSLTGRVVLRMLFSSFENHSQELNFEDDFSKLSRYKNLSKLLKTRVTSLIEDSS